MGGESVETIVDIEYGRLTMRRFWTVFLVLLLGAALTGCAATKKKGGAADWRDNASIVASEPLE